MHSLSRAIRAIILAGALAAPAIAQTPPPSGPLDAAARKEAVDRAANLLRTRYIFPDAGENAAKKIEAELAAGAYDTLADPWAFASKITADLQSVTNDKHVRMTPPGPPPAGAAMPDRPPPPPRSEAGVVRADKLAGDIGYIEISGFPPPDLFKAAVDKAMPKLLDSKALIVDVRRNGGGTPDAVAYLVSWFLDPAKPPMLINTFHNRRAGTTELTTRDQMSVKAAGSYRGKPVYVLTSKWTFSGGEEFAYDMQAFKLGTLVGETTGGGANPGGVVPVGPRFGLFVPNGRPVNAVTKTNWEGVGVKPEIVTPPADALKVTLEKLGQKPTSGDIDALSQAKLFQPRSTQQPGSEAALRRAIADLARGEPDYTQMSPILAEATRQQLPAIKADLIALGALESVTFREVGPQGSDVYDVKFANGSLVWMLSLDAEGKVANSGIMGPRPPQ